MGLSKKPRNTATTKPITNKPKVKAKVKAKEKTKVEPQVKAEVDTDSDKLVITSTDFSFRTTNSTYNLLKKIVEESGVSGEVFSISLRMLAADLYLWAKVFREIEVDGATYETTSTAGDKVTKVNPAMEVYDKAFKRVTVGLKAHGLDPASASSITKTESDSKTQLFQAMANMLGGGDLEDEFN